ncbi:unnamed protein product, partial [Closterium sp. Yama58-4]
MGDTIFYGSLYNGFIHVRLNVTRGGRSYVFSMTYVTQVGASRDVMPAWMFNTSLLGEEVLSRPDSPFQLVAYSSFLHDLTTLNSTLDYRRAATSHLLPSMRHHLQGARRRVTVFGPWAAREDIKPRWVINRSNNVRGIAFEEEASRLLPQEGFERFMPMTSLTLPRAANVAKRRGLVASAAVLLPGGAIVLLPSAIVLSVYLALHAVITLSPPDMTALIGQPVLLYHSQSPLSQHKGAAGLLITEQQFRRTARVTEAPAWDDAVDGWTDLRLAARVKYRPSSSSHQVCFTAPFPGPYLLSLHLVFTNVCQLRTILDRAYNQGYQNYSLVALRKLQVSSPPRYSPDAL